MRRYCRLIRMCGLLKIGKVEERTVYVLGCHVMMATLPVSQEPTSAMSLTGKWNPDYSNAFVSEFSHAQTNSTERKETDLTGPHLVTPVRVGGALSPWINCIYMLSGGVPVKRPLVANSHRYYEDFLFYVFSVIMMGLYIRYSAIQNWAWRHVWRYSGCSKVWRHVWRFLISCRKYP